MKVLINADDFGYGENKTLAIADAMSKGLITTTTAMANMPFFDEAIKIAKERDFIDQVGLHFNLTEGRALTSEMRNCPLFCDKNGFFTLNFHLHLKTRLFLSREYQEVIAIEAEAQIKRYLDAGCTLKHLDSHHHVHTDFSVAQPLLRVAKKYGFKSVRLSRTIGDHITVDKRVYKVFFNTYLKSKMPVRVDEFTEFGGFDKYRCQIPSEARVEIMMHPQYLQEKDGSFNSAGPLLDTERNMSGDAGYWENLEKLGIERSNYSTL